MGVGIRGGARAGVRAYSTDEGGLTHLDEEGRARMVDVGDKPVTQRVAEAECWLEVSGRLLRLLAGRRLAKGDALVVAEVAGAMAAKRAADLIPLCHPLPLECVRVRVSLPPAAGAGAEAGDDAEGAEAGAGETEAGTGGGGRVRVRCEVRCRARTGAEMEALTGCAVAALALYDMCKAVDRAITVTELRLVHKRGGSRGPWPPAPPASPDLHRQPRDDRPLAETYVPTNLAHF